MLNVIENIQREKLMLNVKNTQKFFFSKMLYVIKKLLIESNRSQIVSRSGTNRIASQKFRPKIFLFPPQNLSNGELHSQSRSATRIVPRSWQQCFDY